MEILVLSSLLFFFIGVYCIAAKKTLLKILVGLMIAIESVHMFLIIISQRTASIVPQTMVITSMVISSSTIAIFGAIIYRLLMDYKTIDVRKIRRLRH